MGRQTMALQKSPLDGQEMKLVGRENCNVVVFLCDAVLVGLVELTESGELIHIHPTTVGNTVRAVVNRVAACTQKRLHDLLLRHAARCE